MFIRHSASKSRIVLNSGDMGKNVKICEICENPLDTCVCCAECGHICSLDNGELYCPVCFPEKRLNDE